jgi:hypothetical protein
MIRAPHETHKCTIIARDVARPLAIDNYDLSIADVI